MGGALRLGQAFFAFQKRLIELFSLRDVTRDGENRRLAAIALGTSFGFHRHYLAIVPDYAYFTARSYDPLLQ